MKTRIKMLTILAAVTATAIVVRAEVEPRRLGPDRRPAEFRCPTCGSPCISKAEIVRQRRMHRRQTNIERPALNQHQQAARARQQEPSIPRRQNQIRKNLRFDIDGDGQLSAAERAARKAYRDVLRQDRAEPRNRPAPQAPVEE